MSGGKANTQRFFPCRKCVLRLLHALNKAAIVVVKQVGKC